MIARWLRELDLLPEEREEAQPCHRGLLHQAAFLAGRLSRGPLEWWSEQREKARLGFLFGRRPSLPKSWRSFEAESPVTAAEKKAAALQQLERRNAGRN